MKPPYEITTEMLRLTASVSEKIGGIKAAKLIKPPTELRKRNRIKSIQSSLEIEGNTLTIIRPQSLTASTLNVCGQK